MAGAGHRRRGAGLRGLARKHHAPGQVRRTPPQLGVDEVGDPPQTQPDRGGDRKRIGKPERRDRIPAREHPGGQHHAQEPAVKRHAALPDAHDLDRVGEVVVRLVEQDEPQPPANDHADDDPGQQFLDLLGRHRGAVAPERRPPHQRHHDPPAGQQTDQIGQRIPAQRELSPRHGDGEDFGRNVGKRDHAGCSVRSGVTRAAVGCAAGIGRGHAWTPGRPKSTPAAAAQPARVHPLVH